MAATNNGSSSLGGWLLKQGPKGPKLWKSRYFELWNDSELHYGATDQNVNPQTSLGYIDLRKATSAENDEKNSTETRFAFALRTPDRTYTLAASSDAERTYWILRIGMFVCTAKDIEPRAEIEKLKSEIAKLRSDIDFETKKNSMQMTDLKRQIETLKKEKDREISELKDMLRQALNLPPTHTPAPTHTPTSSRQSVSLSPATSERPSRQSVSLSPAPSRQSVVFPRK
eukprot:Phypoly_transcript_06525.p1 GENE.Phypoly_transcript_06525~~Phypoly_transcript_06525.p1  ORF type:complete len:228 (-),score=33.83 Phypoly_transcript_06525:85-768(-)